MGPVAAMGGGGGVGWDNFFYFDPSDKYSQMERLNIGVSG